MITFSQYLYEAVSDDLDKALKLSELDKKKLIDLDKRYGELFVTFKYNLEINDISNYDEEWEKFKKARSEKKKYYPQLKYPVKNYLEKEWFDSAKKLKRAFENFDCYMSKYYIENIDQLSALANFVMDKSEKNLNEFNKLWCPKQTEENYKYALELLKRHPWENKIEDQPYTGPEVVKELQKHIDKLNIDFKAVVDPYMIPRMGVRGERKILTIRKDAHFSDIDLGSLKVHEVEVHCKRRDCGIKQGLFIMLFGLPYFNTLDEGLAIFNSINYNPKGLKPNLFWDIAIKVIIGYNIDKDFCELYDFIYDLCKADKTKGLDENLFRNLIRTKRFLGDCKLNGGDTLLETDYLNGYLIVKGLSKELQKELVEYNIGPKQLTEFDNIKRFFKVNKFEKIDPLKLKAKKWVNREGWY